MEKISSFLGISVGEFTVAVVTSLVASIVFWLFFDRIPRRRDQKRIQPLVDFDLYQVYMKLIRFIDTPFQQFENTISQYRQEIFTGKLTEDDFKVFLSTKCLTEGHRDVDDMAKHLLPIGDQLRQSSEEIERIIDQLYVFNHYLSAKQIMICRQISDKLNTFSYDRPASYVERSGAVYHLKNPTVKYMSRMFSEVYSLYLQLQNYLVNSNIRNVKMFENYRMIMESTRVSNLFSQGKYKKVCRMTKKTDNRMASSFYFRSLFMLNKKELTEKALIDYLNHTSVPLISLRNILGEVIADERMKAVLITERSQDEFNEMINCLEKERMSKESYRTFAERMMEYYQEKEKIKQ